MTENTKKMLSFLIAVAMLFSMTPMNVVAQGQVAFEQPATETTEPAPAPVTEPAPLTESIPEVAPLTEPGMKELELDVVTDATIPEGETYAYFSFTPVETGTYVFESLSDSVDTYGELYEVCEEETVEIARNDDGGENNNFQIAMELLEGHTYQLWVRSYSREACSFPFLVKSLPLQSITFSPISVVEGTGGALNEWWDGEIQDYVEYYYYDMWNLVSKSTYTATFTDGNVVSNNGTGLNYDDQWYSFAVSGNQNGTNPWTAGNTYYIDVSVMGKTVQVPVTIVASPLQSISFAPVTIREKTNGYFTSYWDEETGEYVQYYHYDLWSLLRKSSYTAIFTDGTVENMDIEADGFYKEGIYYDGQQYVFSLSGNQSGENQWTVGNTYYVDVSIMGKTVQMPVTIAEPPLQSLTITPAFVMENTKGYNHEFWEAGAASSKKYYHYYEWDAIYNSRYTATFTDGTVLSGDVQEGGFYYEGEWCSFGTSSNQSWDNPWTAGNTYNVEVTVMGKTWQAPVTITESPLESIAVTPVSVVENTNGNFNSYWDEETESNVEYYRYDEWALFYKSEYTLTFTDGTVLTGSDSEFTYNGERYNFSVTSYQEGEDPWSAGNTYNVYVGVMGKSAEIPVTITASPLESITFTPVSLVEYTLGDWTGSWDEETGEYVEYYWYYWGNLVDRSTYTATFTDGTVLTGSCQDDGIEYNGQWYSFNTNTSQGVSNQWMSGNTYYIDVSVMGKTGQIPVTIEKSPLESITFTPVKVIEKTNGYYTRGSYGNPEEGTEVEEEYYRYDEWGLCNLSEYTATFADGTVITGNGSGFVYDDLWYSFNLSSDQWADRPWTAGNTYYVNVSVMGKTGQIPVTITEMPLQDITFKPVSVMTGSNGYLSQYWDEETESYVEYYRYDEWNLFYKSEYTLTFTDGTKITGEDSEFVYDGQRYGFSVNSNQSGENPWIAGNTYYIDVSVMDKTWQLPVTIQESPLQNITFAPISVMAGTCGSVYEDWDDETESYVKYYKYQLWNLFYKSEYTLTFADGTVLNGEESDFKYDGQWFNFSLSSDQSAREPWTVGNTYYVEATVMGKTGQIPVTITESPLQSLTFTPVTVVEYTNGYASQYWDDETESYEKYYYYNVWELLDKSQFTATFKDGTAQSGEGDNLYYNGDWYGFALNYSQGSHNQWTVGNTYTLTASVLGVTAEIPVTIVESPVASVTFDTVSLEEHKLGDWEWDWETDEKYFHYSWESMLNYTITFKDGTVKSGSYYSPVVYNGETYRLSDCSDEQSAEEPWLTGNTYTAQVNFHGKEYDVYVSVHKSTEDNGFQYIVQDGKAIITSCTTTGEILVIPETIDGYTVVGITSLGEALYYATEIRIPDCVTMLSADVFGSGSMQIPLRKLVLGKGISSITLYTAWSLEWIEVSKKNPYICSIDGVVYDKDVTTLLVYPTMKLDKHVIPDSVTAINVDWTDQRYAKVNVQFGAGIKDYKLVDGIIYNADMTTVIRATDAATGSYTMPESVTNIASYAFKNTNLTAVSVSPNVTGIVYTAFENCTNLKELTIPKSVQSLSIRGCWNLEKVHITDLAAWCGTSVGDSPLESGADLYVNGEKIVDLVIPDTVKTIKRNVFRGGNFASVTIPSSVTRIDWGAFGGCDNMKKVCITDLAAWCNINFEYEDANPLYYAKNLYVNGEQVTDLVIPDGVKKIKPYTFCGGNFKSLTIPAAVTTIGDSAFSETAIESVSLPEGLQIIGGYAFAGTALKSVELPDSLTNLGWSAFSGCRALESVDLGNGLTIIEDGAFRFTGLKSVTIPKQVTDIYWNAFEYSELTQVQFNCDEVSVWGSAFAHCPLGDLEFGDNVKQIDSYTFNDINATQIKLPASVTEISYRTFAFNTNLVSITIPDTVEYIYSTSFQGDTNLSHVLYTGTQEQWDALEVESPELNQATLHCEAVGNEVTTEQTCTHIRLFCTICNKWETVKKQNASHTFVDDVCSVCGQEGYWEYVVDEQTGEVTITGYLGNETWVEIPSKLEGLPVTAFAAGTFAYNNKIVEVIVSENIKEIPDGAFRGCQSLAYVGVDEGVTTIGSYAFYDCNNLYYVDLPNTVTTIGEYAFSETNIEEIQLSENLTTLGEGAFSSCFDLEAVTIPGSLKVIPKDAFSRCYDMERIIISEGVTEICYNAFSGCYYLEELQLPDTLVSIGEIAFASQSLKELEIPANVKTIGAGAFINGGYRDLETVIFRGAKPVMDGAFEGKFTAFYDPTLPGWQEYIESYEGDIVWYASGAPVMRVQPQDITVESGSKATVSAEAYGHRLRYQWYYAPYGSDTFTAIGGNSIELSMVMDAKNPNVRVYCVISDVLGRTTTTETVTMKIDAEPTGIRIAKMPYTVEYALNQALRTDGLEVVLIFSDSTEMPIKDYQISGYNPKVGGEQVVTVSYGSFMAYFSVTVNADKLHFADEQTGLEISASKDALDSDAILTVEILEDQELPDFFQDKLTIPFRITMQKDGETVQPREEVKVSVPVSGYENGNRCKIYFVDDQGNIEDTNAVLAGNYFEFYTSSFGTYVFVELPAYTVSGHIASPAGTKNVTVNLIYNERIVQTLQTTTGEYTFNDVIDGKYTLAFNADEGKVRSYAIVVDGADVKQNVSLVEHTVTFLDWDERVITSEQYFEGSLVTVPSDPVRQNDRTYSYTFTGWDKKITPCTEDAVYTATYSYSYLNDAGSITVGSTMACVGEKFVIPVSVTDNLGIAGLKHTLTFDATALKLIGVEFQGDFAQGTPVINDGKADEGLLTVLWFGNDDVISDDVIYNLEFEVLETATNKKAEITIDFDVDGNANSAGENVIFDAVNGIVDVRTYWLGDLNGDRKFGMVDLVMLAQYVADFEMELTENQLLSADVNEDGNIDIHDVVLLNQWLLSEEF